MADFTMGEGEARFAEIIWQSEPLSSSELARRSEQLLNWKKSTSFTVLRRLCQKGIFQSENGVVTSKMSKEEYASLQSKKFVEETFGGSLPAFLAAFTAQKQLTPEEIEELRRMIEAHEEGRI